MAYYYWLQPWLHLDTALLAGPWRRTASFRVQCASKPTGGMWCVTADRTGSCGIRVISEIYLALAGIVLALSSVWTIIPAMIAFVIAVVRTALEDRTLQEELPGYKEYAQRVRYRLIPGYILKGILDLSYN